MTFSPIDVQGHALEDPESALDPVIRYERAQRRPREASPAPAAAVRIEARPFEWIDAEAIPVRKWIYGKHYVRRFVSATVAPGGTGKTALGNVEACAMVSGKSLLGVPVKERVKVWLVNLEDPYEEMQRRVAAIARHYDLTREDLAGLFMNSGRDTPIVIAEKVRDAVVVQAPIVEAIEATIRANSIDVMIIDPFVSSHSVGENDNAAIDRVAKTWAGIADRCNCSIELVHHVRKSGFGQTEYTMEDARGGSALVGAVRAGRVLNVMTADEAGQADVPAESRKLYFRLGGAGDKNNMSPPVDKASWHRIVGVGLGNGGGLSPQDEVGVVTSWSLPNALDEWDGSQHPGALIRLVRECPEYRANPQSGSWIGQAVAQVAGWDADDTADRLKIKKVLNSMFRDEILKKITRKDSSRQPREFVDVGDKWQD